MARRARPRCCWPAILFFTTWKAWPAFAGAAVIYAGSLFWQSGLQPNDDLVAYYNFCEKLLTTGSFDDPFSWRRLASLGGHTLLQCSVLVHGSYANAKAFEIALCPVILLGLILGFRGGTLGRSSFGLLLGLTAITTPIIRSNSASHLTGIVLFVGLFVTLDLAERTQAQRLRLLAVAGVIAAGLCSLRAQNVVAAGGALGLFWLASWIKERPSPRAALIAAGCCGGSLCAALLPWMIMSFRSNGSPLFPLFQGGNNLAFNPQALDGTLHARLAIPVQMILHPALLPLLLCLLAAPAWRHGLAARAVSISAALTAFMVAWSITLAPDETTIPRYIQPLLLAGALAVLMTAAVTSRGRLLAWALGIMLLVTNLPERCLRFWQHYAELAHTGKLIVPFRGREILDCRAAQALIPEGKRILVCGDFPLLFDHARNPIWNIDLPHGTSPSPGLPFQKPPEETKRYLRQLGVEYLIFVDFAKSTSLYCRATWQEHEHGEIALWKIQAPFYLDFFATTDRLASTETTLGRVGNLTVLQLNP